jgi:hypothetical protein
VPFEPQQVFFLVAFSENRVLFPSGGLVPGSEGEQIEKASALGDAPSFRRYEGQIYAPPIPSVGSAVAGETPGRSNSMRSNPMRTSSLRVGTIVSVPRGAEFVHYAAILAAPQNRFALIAPQSIALTDPELYHGNPDRLREYVQQERRRLQKLQRESDELEAELRRLRADADLIADLSRIVDAREELARLRRMTDELVLDKENLRSFVQGVQSVPTPRSFASRVRQLNGQLAELVAIEKEQSANPHRIGQGAPVEHESIEEMLAAIEAARGLDLEALRAERAKLSGEPQQPTASDRTRGLERPEDYIQ